MKLGDIIERKPVKKQRGATGPQRYRASLKGRDGHPLASAYGDTQQAADLALLERLRQPFRGDYTPLCLCFRGETAVIWRVRDGEWIYGWLHDGEAEPSGQTWGGWTSRDEVERVARRHLAENVWKQEETSSPVLTNQEDQEAFRAWAIKERHRLGLWRLLHARGWNDQESRAIMDRFWQQLDPARVEALGDPRQLVAAYEQREQMPVQMPYTQQR